MRFESQIHYHLLAIQPCSGLAEDDSLNSVIVYTTSVPS
jgi:hypothetical protein